MREKNFVMQNLEKIQKAGILRAGVSISEGINSAPWAWKDSQTKLILGFEADIAREIASELDVEVKFVELEPYRLFVSLINDSCDICISALKPENTSTGIAYTNPYYVLTQKMVTLKDSNIYDLVDLKGYKVGVLKKSLGELIIQEKNSDYTPAIKITPYNDVLDLFSALQFKDVEAVFIDSPVALWYANTYLDKGLQVSETSYKSGSYAIAVREEDPSLRLTINRALTTIPAREILEKYGLWDEAQKDL